MTRRMERPLTPTATSYGDALVDLLNQVRAYAVSGVA